MDGLTVTFENCTILIHVGKVEEFRDLIQEFVEDGLLTQQVADQLLGDERDKSE